MKPQEEKVQQPVQVRFALVALAFELLIVILYGAFVDYAPTVDAQNDGLSGEVPRYYGLYQDVHVMIFIGFGFLMTFLSKYGFGAVGLNFLLAAMSIQWGMLLVGIFHWIHVGHKDTIGLSMTTLIEGDFAAGAVLITFGAVLGKTSPLQMVGIMFFELIFYNLNFLIGALKLEAVDMGGSTFVHTFGAYFGLSCAWVLGRKMSQSLSGHAANGSSKISDTFAMVGTIFLWMFWPSFNGALADPVSQHRVIVNTVLSLCGSCIGAFLFSQILRQGKFSMVDIQNATLAGGVAIGSAADLVVGPWAAILIGIFASGVSVWGYTMLMPVLETKLCLFDTCGVHNLHGMPGLIGGITGAIASAAVGDEIYGQNIGTVYPARALGRSAGEQAGMQLLALAITVAIAVTSGACTGLIVQSGFFQPPEEKGLFSDHLDWDDVEEGDAIFEHHAASHDHAGHAKEHDHLDPTCVNVVPGAAGEVHEIATTI
jgi:ammonium transporter Rh